MPQSQRESSSFRDNRGFVYYEDGVVYRQINTSGQAAYDLLMTSGLYEQLTRDGLLIAHDDVTGSKRPAGVYKVIKPEQVPVISYSYEWSFSQLKDAALATLAIQTAALSRGLTLRDASAYNIQFVNGRPVLIDTLSFEEHTAGEPWVAYRQFCQHFLAPLALMSRVDLQLSQLLRIHIDGIPLPLAAKLLPVSARLNFGIATHISLHARFQRQHESVAEKTERTMSQTSLQGLFDSLERTVKQLKLPKTKTQWGDYYDHTNYTDDAMKHKGQLVEQYLASIKPKRVTDLGSNDGFFSRIAAQTGAEVISADIDPLAVDSNYRRVKRDHEANLLPLLVDLTNPSPALGWAHHERRSFSERASADVVLALALIHHLAIANNLPLESVADYFAELAPRLIIEFVPKEDSQVRRLLATREDIFDTYTVSGFEAAFAHRYTIVAKEAVEGSSRTLYDLHRKGRTS